MLYAYDLDKDFFIFGLPLKTELGEVRFLSYFEYLQHLYELSLMKLNVLHFYYQYRNAYEMEKFPKEERDEIEKSLLELKNESLFNIVRKREDIKSVYEKMFTMLIENPYASKTIFESEELFMFYRKLILDMNITLEDEVSPNEEIQKGIEMGRKINQQKGEKTSFVDIVTSIVASTNISFEDISNMNVFQVNAMYARICAIYNYQTSTLFATVSEQEIESWSKHIDLFDNGSSGTMKRSEFDKKFGKLL